MARKRKSDQPRQMIGYRSGEIDFDIAMEKLLPKQKEYLSTRSRYAAFLGGLGSGKTVSLCMSAIVHGQYIPGGLFLLGRLTEKSLKDTTRRTFLELIPADLVKEYREGANSLICTNGSEYLFRHLDIADENLNSHLRSLNLSGFYMDEASECSENMFLTLMGRLRRKTEPQIHFGRLAGNPAGRDWVWKRFFDPDRSDKFKENIGILAPTTENINLPEGYVNDLLHGYPADWVERFVYGSFADLEGAVYKEFDYRKHVYDATVPHEIFKGRTSPPEDWPVIVGVDIGGVDPWGWVFIAIHPSTGSLFVFDEIYEAGIRVRDLADRYHAIVRDRNVTGMAYDYENQQAAIELGEHNVSGTPAIKAKKPGIFKVAQYIHPDPRLTHLFTGIPPGPRLYIASNCENLIREISTYRWAKDRQGNWTGETIDGNDHCVDGLRYSIHTFRPDPREEPPTPSWMRDGLDVLSRMYWYDQAKYDKMAGVVDGKRRLGRRYYAGKHFIR